jgi:uncharacterized coiled-coil protein SlyX
MNLFTRRRRAAAETPEPTAAERIDAMIDEIVKLDTVERMRAALDAKTAEIRDLRTEVRYLHVQAAKAHRDGQAALADLVKDLAGATPTAQWVIDRQQRNLLALANRLAAAEARADLGPRAHVPVLLGGGR